MGDSGCVVLVCKACGPVGLIIVQWHALSTHVSMYMYFAVQVGVTQVDADVLQQAKEAEVVTFGSPSAVK